MEEAVLICASTDPEWSGFNPDFSGSGCSDAADEEESLEGEVGELWPLFGAPGCWLSTWNEGPWKKKDFLVVNHVILDYLTRFKFKGLTSTKLKDKMKFVADL